MKLNRVFLKSLLIFFCVSFVVFQGKAQVEHSVLRRVVVFPLKIDRQWKDVADDSWWAIREELTKNRRFLVASKQFLLKKDVFQSRKNLKPADAVILGRILDAHAIIVTYLKKRKLIMEVYNGESGYLFWRQKLTLHPSLTLREQIKKSTVKLIKDFMASIPYQGFQIIDPLVGTPIYEEGDVRLARIDVGGSTRAEAGDPVQWIRLTRKGAKPLFLGGGNIQVLAEGRVVETENEILTVEILRTNDLKQLKEGSLVRLPKEHKRLRDKYSLESRLLKRIEPEVLASQLRTVEPSSSQVRPLVTVLSFIGNIAIFLLLAF